MIMYYKFMCIVYVCVHLHMYVCACAYMCICTVHSRLYDWQCLLQGKLKSLVRHLNFKEMASPSSNSQEEEPTAEQGVAATPKTTPIST